jgi:hypothetical protein
MGSHYVYKIFRKIKIVKYRKVWPNHIYRTELLMLTHQKLCLMYVIWPYFTVFYYFNLTKYFVNVMGSH